jgi:hypothetical protein
MSSSSPESVNTEVAMSPSDLEKGRFATEKVINPDVLHHQDSASMEEYTA